MRRLIALGMAFVLIMAITSCNEKNEISSEELSSLSQEGGYVAHSQPAGAAESVQSGPSGSAAEEVFSSEEASLPEDTKATDSNKGEESSMPDPIAFISDQRVWESVWQEADWDKDAVKIISSVSEWDSLEFPEKMPAVYSEESFYDSNRVIVLAELGVFTGNTVPYAITDTREEEETYIAEVTFAAEAEANYP